MEEINYPREIMGAIMRVNRLHRNVIEKRFKELGVHRTQHMMLVYLAKSKEPISQKALAERFDVSPAAIAISLKKMEKNGLIERSTSPNDSRVNIIKVSEDGMKLLDETRELFMAMDAAAIGGIDKEMLERMLYTLSRITDNLVSLGAVDDAPCKKK